MISNSERKPIVTRAFPFTASVLLLLVSVLLAGCIGGGGGGGGNDDSGPAVSELRVSPPSVQVPEGTEADVTATAIYEDGTSRDVTEDATWRVRDTDVARISLADGVRVSGRTRGVSPVEARFGGRSGFSEVEVTSGDVESLAITWESDGAGPDDPPPELAQGETLRLAAEATYAGGVVRDVTGEAGWSSDSDAVASVDNDSEPGLVRGESEGGARITATLDDVTAQIDVTVGPRVLEAIAITPEDKAINQGEITRFTATASYNVGDTRDVTSQVEWSIADTDIAIVSNASGTRGRVAGLQPGDTQVMASLGDVSASTGASLLVNEAPAAPRRLLLSAQPNVILADGQDTTRLRARVRPNDPEQQVVADGTMVDFSRGGQFDQVIDLSATAAATVDQVATVDATASAAGIDLLRARVPDTLADGVAFVVAVDDFSEIVLSLALEDTLPGSDDPGLYFYIFNASNRAFDLLSAEYYEAGELDGRIDVDGDQLRGNTILGLPPVDLGSKDPETFEARFRLRDPATGVEFAVTVSLP